MSIAKSCPIVCEGKEFSSIKEFANYYGLNYSKVQYYRKQGKTSSEIIDACRFSSASKSEVATKPSSKRFAVSYEGVDYPSLYAAATTLGLNPSYVYELRKRNNLSPAGALSLALEKQAGPKQKASAAKQCTIEGTTYESREEAIKAYGVPRITVYSRMERDGVSFEEALVQGRKAALYCPPTMSLFPSLHFVEDLAPVPQPTLDELSSSLFYYKRKVKRLKDVITLLPALLVDDNTYIFLNHEAHGLEFVSILPYSASLETLNILNSAYVTAKVFYNDITHQLLLSGFQIAKEENQEIKSLIYAYFSFASIREQLSSRLSNE